MGRVLMINGDEIYGWYFEGKGSFWLNGTFSRKQLWDRIQDLVKEGIGEDILEEIAIISIILQKTQTDPIKLSNQ